MGGVVWWRDGELEGEAAFTGWAAGEAAEVFQDDVRCGEGCAVWGLWAAVSECGDGVSSCEGEEF